MKSFKFLLKTKYALLALLVTAAGCADLSVDNQNSPTTDQVLSSPADIESLVQTGFVSWWQAQSDVMLMACVWVRMFIPAPGVTLT